MWVQMNHQHDPYCKELSLSDLLCYWGDTFVFTDNIQC